MYCDGCKLWGSFIFFFVREWECGEEAPLSGPKLPVAGKRGVRAQGAPEWTIKVEKEAGLTFPSPPAVPFESLFVRPPTKRKAKRSVS